LTDAKIILFIYYKLFSFFFYSCRSPHIKPAGTNKASTRATYN